MAVEKILLSALLIAAMLPCSVLSEIDKSRYITIDEIKPEMSAYCLTVYQGTEIEKFPLKIVSVMKNFRPGRDAILVMGVDDRFKHTGPVAGCSGSPVFIDDRLAGALAFGWGFSKDPLYGVTPIEEMLQVGKYSDAVGTSAPSNSLNIDFAKPLDFETINEKYKAVLQSTNSGSSQMHNLAIPLTTSLPANSMDFAEQYLQPLGLIPVAGPSYQSTAAADVNDDFQCGSILSIPMVSGDISLSGIGTVTEVVGDKIYGFGHSMFGQGPTELPIANGYVHTVVSNLIRSFKLGQAGQIIGTLRQDQSAAVYGITGQSPPLIPLQIKISRYNDIPKTYDCFVARHKMLTPVLVAISIFGSVNMKDNLPAEHTIEYKCTLDIDGFEPIKYRGITSNSGAREMVLEVLGILAVGMNNPYKQLDFKGISFEANITNKSSLSTISELEISDTKIKPGQTVEVLAIIEKYQGPKHQTIFNLKIPQNTNPGRYTINIAGPDSYAGFLAHTQPQKYIADDAESLVSSIREMLSVPKRKIYLTMALPASGITINKAELSDLPSIKAIPLISSSRTAKIRPYNHWIEMQKSTDDIILNEMSINVTIEK